MGAPSLGPEALERVEDLWGSAQLSWGTPATPIAPSIATLGEKERKAPYRAMCKNQGGQEGRRKGLEPGLEPGLEG